MIQVTTPNQFIREHLRFSPLQYMLDAAAENPRLAAFYADMETAPRTCACLFNHMLFVGGAFQEACFDFLANRLLSAQAPKIAYVFDGTVEWDEAFMNRFAGACKRYERSVFQAKPTAADILLPPEIWEITKIMPFENFEMIAGEVAGTATYDGLDDFFKRGLCFAPVIGNKVCGFCTSEYPSARAVAIGIEVLKPYQKRGLAKAMTNAFLQRAAQKGYTVYWDCWKNNTASLRTALACGFEKMADYPMLFLQLDPAGRCG